MASIRQAVVCRLHHPDYWKLCQGWNSYVLSRRKVSREVNEGQDSLRLISTRHSLPMRLESYQDLELSLLVSAPVLQSRC